MRSRYSLGLIGLLAVVCTVGGYLLGAALLEGLGGLLGLMAGFLLSGWVLRRYFVGREAAADG